MTPTIPSTTSTTGHSEIDRRAYWRYHFAGLAMQGIVNANPKGFDNEQHIAMVAVVISDALLAELEKGEK